MQFRSIQTRVTVTLVSLALIPTLIIGIALLSLTYSVQQTQVLRLQNQIAGRLSDNLMSFVQERIAELQLASEIRGLQNREPDEQRSALTELLSYQPAFDDLAILDATGMEDAHVSRLEIITPDDLTNRADTPEFQVPFSTGDIYYGPVRVDETTGQLVFTLSLPLRDIRTSETTHVLTADIRLQFLSALLADTELSDDVYILNDAGRVVAHENSSLVLRGTQFAVPESEGLYQGLQGENVVLAFNQVQFGDQTLTFVAEERQSDAFELITNTLIILAAILVTTLLMALLFGIIATRSVTQPIRELVAAAKQVQAGNLNQRVPIRTEDEVGVLAQTFNSMTEQLQQFVGGLEQRVAERTRDLELAAEVSKEAASVVDLQVLLPRVAELTQTAFSLYHVSVFVYDKAEDVLRLEAGTGDVGERMKQMNKRFHLQKGHGLVPKAARERTIVVINNIQKSAEHLPNPLLPETQAEVALPMVVAGNLIGVLDLQSERADRFTADDLRILQTLADRIAVAIRNAQLFAETVAARQEAERANNVKSMFLASMSHELRTPLNSIINFTEFVVRGVMGPLNERQANTLRNVISSGEHLLTLINDVLDISKIESGSLKLFIEPDVNISEIVEAAVKTGQGLLKDKPVQLITEIEPDLPTVSIDRQRILQVVLNIVSNACKFTKQGEIKLSVRRQGNEMLWSVADTGPGIAPEDYAAVFEKFAQTDTGLRQGGGTGLGMPISRSLIEAHGGKIWIASTLGVGATFFFTLPLQNISEPQQTLQEM